jgi:pimeloyl-ACP methyl ester carboxylesterase
MTSTVFSLVLLAWVPAQQPGVVFVVSGVGGTAFLSRSAQWALKRAGVSHQVRDFRWTHGTGRILRDLQDIRHLLAKADELAVEVLTVQHDDPARPIYLLGHSGGAGLVLAAAERLPAGTVERIILLSPAVSPGFDLRPALCATRGEIISFHSCLDCFWLDWGTRLFGTIDRVYGPSAGLNGFELPAGLSAEEQAAYRRLVQIGWEPEMIFAGHGGLHASTCMPSFLSRYVAPWLKP